jgi:hypothetical protein
MGILHQHSLLRMAAVTPGHGYPLAGLLEFKDARLGISVTDGQKISVWADQHTPAYASGQTDIALQPVYLANVDGHPAVYLNGSSKIGSDYGQIFPAGNTVFAFIKIIGPVADTKFLIQSAVDGFYLYVDTAGKFKYYNGNNRFTNTPINYTFNWAIVAFTNIQLETASEAKIYYYDLTTPSPVFVTSLSSSLPVAGRLGGIIQQNIYSRMLLTYSRSMNDNEITAILLQIKQNFNFN